MNTSRQLPADLEKLIGEWFLSWENGPEWKALMTRAGFEPRVHIQLDGPFPPNACKEPTVWEHRCPVCQKTRVAFRRVPQWRCSNCVEDGLDGKLVIERADG